MSTVLKVDRLSFGFSTTVPLDYLFSHVSLDLAAGSIISLVGPSGSGKTTLLRIIGGFLPPNEGSIFYKGQDIYGDLKSTERLSLRRTSLLSVFSKDCLIESFTVDENVHFALSVCGVERSDTEIRNALQTLELLHRRDRRANSLSSGEKQRASLLRALLVRPEILICDEPTSALDKTRREIVANSLLKLRSDFGTTILFSTHDTKLAEISDTVFSL
jgi:ABC-type lipoprotein export system ATPase subunit